jgi:hypothetical protein
MGYIGGGINGALRWRDLALDELLPLDEEKEELKKAAEARKLASGTSSNQPQPHPHQHQQATQDQTMDEDEEDDENDENDDNDEDDEDDPEPMSEDEGSNE